MLRSRLVIGLAVLALLGTISGCGGDTGESPGAANTITLQGYVTVDAYHYDEATGTYVHFYHDESSNLMTTLGLNWIETQLGDFANSTTDTARYISLSLDATSPAAGWTQIITELAAGGLTRAVGAYSTTGGDGVWTISNTFTATTTHTNVQLTGLQYASTGDGNLMAANTFTPVSLANLDTLTVTWTISVAQL